MTNKVRNQMERWSNGIREELKEAFNNDELINIIDEALDIKFLSRSPRELLGAEIAVTLGGPNIYIDTYRQQVQVYWSGDSYITSLGDDITEELNNVLEELYFC